MRPEYVDFGADELGFEHGICHRTGIEKKSTAEDSLYKLKEKQTYHLLGNRDRFVLAQAETARTFSMESQCHFRNGVELVYKERPAGILKKKKEIKKKKREKYW